MISYCNLRFNRRQLANAKSILPLRFLHGFMAVDLGSRCDGESWLGGYTIECLPEAGQRVDTWPYRYQNNMDKLSVETRPPNLKLGVYGLFMATFFRRQAFDVVTEPTSLLQLKLQLSRSDLGKHDINMSLTSCCYRLVDFNDAKIQRKRWCHMICVCEAEEIHFEIFKNFQTW